MNLDPSATTRANMGPETLIVSQIVNGFAFTIKFLHSEREERLEASLIKLENKSIYEAVCFWN